MDIVIAAMVFLLLWRVVQVNGHRMRIVQDREGDPLSWLSEEFVRTARTVRTSDRVSLWLLGLSGAYLVVRVWTALPRVADVAVAPLEVNLQRGGEERFLHREEWEPCNQAFAGMGHSVRGGTPARGGRASTP